MSLSKSEESAETLTRWEAIERIRQILWEKTPEYECSCAPAAPLGAVCGGFGRLDDVVLWRRFGWLAANRADLTRRQLEGLVAAHHVSSQQSLGASTCCDVETRERCGCEGWNQFSNAQLEDLYRTVAGRPVHIGD